MAEKNRTKRLAMDELALFSEQLSLFLHAGMTPVAGLDVMLEDAGGRLYQVCRSAEERLSEYMSLHEALEQTGAFPDYYVKMVQVGETSGMLEEIFDQLSHFYQREEALRKRIRNAAAYPAALFVLMAAVMALLLIKVLPMFEDILRSLGGQLPGFAKGLMELGSWLGRWGLLFLAIVLALVIGARLFISSARGAPLRGAFSAKAPLFRSMSAKIAAERFSGAMYALLKSGMLPDEALGMSASLVGNSYIAAVIARCADDGAEGDALDKLLAAGVFPKLFSRLLGSSIETGDTVNMMRRLSELYERQTDETLKKLTALIEPVCVGIMAVLVAAILISVMLPLVDIMSAIG